MRQYNVYIVAIRTQIGIDVSKFCVRLTHIRLYGLCFIVLHRLLHVMAAVYNEERKKKPTEARVG